MSDDINNIYVGLILSGYDYYPRTENAEKLVNCIQNFDFPEDVIDSFKNLKSTHCKVYPYWPMVFILEYIILNNLFNLESAKMVLDNLDQINPIFKNYDILKKLYSVHEKGKSIKSSKDYEVLLKLFKNDFKENELKLIHILEKTTRLYEKYFEKSLKQDYKLLYIPLKAPEATDIIKLKDAKVVSASKFDIKSIYHEMIHDEVGLMLKKNKELIVQNKQLFTKVKSAMLKLQYAWDDSDESWINVFEEFYMRALVHYTFDSDEELINQEIDLGFIYIRDLILCMEKTYRLDEVGKILRNFFNRLN